MKTIIALLIVSFVLIPLIDLKELRQINNRPAAVSLYIVLLASGLTIAVLLMLDKAPVSPARLIEKLIALLPGRS